MSAVQEASLLLRDLAEPRPVGDSVKAAITRAARLAGLPANRTENIWRREARAIRAEEMDAIREAKQRHARAEYRRLLDKIEALEREFAVTDAGFHREVADEARGLLARARAFHGRAGGHG